MPNRTTEQLEKEIKDLNREYIILSSDGAFTTPEKRALIHLKMKNVADRIDRLQARLADKSNRLEG